MSCCGKHRQQLAFQNAPQPQQRPTARPHGASAIPARVVFEYDGRTALVVVGPISGTRYRFNGPRARLAVDPRDRRSLAAVPHLRQIT